MPTLRHVKVFVEVAKYSKMNEAAKYLYMAPSSVSQAILELEQHYNVRLFERMTKRLMITEAGAALLEDAKRIVEDFEIFESHTQDWNESTIIKIGVSGLTSAMLINKVINQFEHELPAVNVRVFSYAPNYCEKHLADNTIDVVLTESEPKNSDIIARPLTETELCFICGPKHRFWGLQQVPIHELNNENFIMPGSSSAIALQLKHFLKENRISFRTDWTAAHDSGTTKLWTIQNRGISAIPVQMAEIECSSGNLSSFKINNKKLTLTTCLS